MAMASAIGNSRALAGKSSQCHVLLYSLHRRVWLYNGGVPYISQVGSAISKGGYCTLHLRYIYNYIALQL